MVIELHWSVELLIGWGKAGFLSLGTIDILSQITIIIIFLNGELLYVL